MALLLVGPNGPYHRLSSPKQCYKAAFGLVTFNCCGLVTPDIYHATRPLPLVRSHFLLHCLIACTTISLAVLSSITAYRGRPLWILQANCKCQLGEHLKLIDEGLRRRRHEIKLTKRVAATRMRAGKCLCQAKIMFKLVLRAAFMERTLLAFSFSNVLPGFIQDLFNQTWSLISGLCHESMYLVIYHPLHHLNFTA